MMTMLLKSILIFIFVVISISDWRTHKIPDRWNAGILLVAVLLALVDSSVSWQERILGMFAVSVPMACLLFFVPGSFGGGDIKFVAAVGGSNPSGRDLLYPASGRKKKRAKDSIRLRPVFMYGYDSSHGVWRRMGCVVFIRID